MILPDIDHANDSERRLGSPVSVPTTRPGLWERTANGVTLTRATLASGEEWRIAPEDGRPRGFLALHVVPAGLEGSGNPGRAHPRLVLTDGSEALILCHGSAEPMRITRVSLPAERLGQAGTSEVRGIVELDAARPGTLALAAYVTAFGDACMQGPEEGQEEDMEGFATAIADLLRHELERRRRARLATLNGAERARVEAVCAFIERHLLSPELSPELIAGEFAMSRATLYRLFEPLGGVGRHIRQQRLHWAAQRIAQEGASRRTLAMLARRLGFSGTRGFVKAYRAAFGQDPGG
ncbi:MAG: hypothetical protein CTY25_03615 [Methylobacterium sp.]|nr:MAG: hypothetical protein CTY25_03615 [Methylobacterium sp.]